ncbi:unnamed protein product [Pylaiella littoralis]
MSEKRGRRQEGGGSSSNGAGRSKKSKKPSTTSGSEKVMAESGQTAQERRALRLRQRELRKEIIEQTLDIGDLTKGNCRDLTEKNAELFELTKFPREAVTDGENMKLIAEGAVAQVKKVTNGAVGVDGDLFLGSVKQFYSKSNGAEDGGAKLFDWTSWGGNVSMVYLAVPEGGGFMMGPIDKPAKVKRTLLRRERILDVDAKEITPETVEKTSKKTKQKLDQTQTRIAQMKKQELHGGTQGLPKDIFETLINPKSFTQTVENFFDFSFLVKSQAAHISIDEESKLPQVTFEGGVQAGGDDESGGSGEGDGGGSKPPAKQWLMSFTPADYRELKELYDIQESNIKHRSEGPNSDYYDPLKDGNRESYRQ